MYNVHIYNVQPDNISKLAKCTFVESSVSFFWSQFSCEVVQDVRNYSLVVKFNFTRCTQLKFSCEVVQDVRNYSLVVKL